MPDRRTRSPRFTTHRLWLGLGLTAGLLAARAADWPQYRGPNTDGTTAEKIAVKWPAGGPKPLWKSPLTTGHSSFAVSGGKAFTLVAREVDGAKREVCVALDAATGKEVWAAPLAAAKYDGGGDDGTEDNKGGDGPRSTPSVKEGLVYVMDARLVLSCLDATTGKPVWTKDLMKEHHGRNIQWQNAASPLIEGDLVLVIGGGPGESILALDRKTGAVIWKAHDEKMTHATPVAATILGTRQIIFFTQSGLVSVDPKAGALLWSQKFQYNISTAASPVVSGDLVYCSAGYDMGAGLYRIAKDGDNFTSAEVWRKRKQLINHWSTPVVKDGHLYGMFQFKEFGKGPLKCVELATGEEKWSQAGFGPGQVILVDGRVLVLSDKGELVLVEADPKAYTEVARAKVLDGKCWSTPCVSGGRVFARSTKEGVCVDVSAQSAQR